MAIYKENKIESFFRSWRYDYLFILWITIILFMLSIFIVAKIWVNADEKITKHRIELLKAKSINDDMNACIELCKTLNLKLISDNEIAKQQEIYNEKEYKFQQQKLEKVHQGIAEKIAPYGTCVYLKNYNEYCFVTKCEGLYAHTIENIMFDVTDFDSYYTVSQREYYIYKKYKQKDIK